MLVLQGRKKGETVEVPPGELVQVYKNLNNGLWSVRRKADGKWRVAGYCERLHMKQGNVIVNESKRREMFKRQERTVHAWVEGTLADWRDRPSTAERVTYDPWHDERFVWLWAPDEAVTFVWEAWFESDKHLWAF